MEILKVAIDSLQPAKRNPNKMSQEELKGLAISLKERGQVKPIVVRVLPKGDYEIVGGHHTWQAMKMNGASDCFIISEGQLTDEEAKLRLLQDNIRGQYVPIELAAILNDLKQSGLSINKIAEKIGQKQFQVEDVLKLLQDEGKLKDLEDDLNQPHLVEVSFVLDDDAGLESSLKRLEIAVLDVIKKFGAKGATVKTTKNAKRESVSVLSVWVVAPARDVIEKAIKHMEEEHDIKRGRALELICADFLSGQKPEKESDGQEKKKEKKA